MFTRVSVATDGMLRARHAVAVTLVLAVAGQNAADDCLTWAAVGECSTNAAFMSSSCTAACDELEALASSLGAFVDNEYLRVMEPDPDHERHTPNRQPREVESGHFVPVRPTELPSPELVVVSTEVCGLLGMTQSTCSSSMFVKLFSGGDLSRAIPGFATSWATPYALSIFGTVVDPNGAGPRGYGYGDGRAISIAEVYVDGSGGSMSKHWELQLKGAGRTPFCRGADGRAVLRSSSREFLVCEASSNLLPICLAFRLLPTPHRRVPSQV